MNDVFRKATPHVIYGNEEACKADAWWKRFYKIEECKELGVEDVKVSNITMGEVKLIVNNRHLKVEGLADHDVIQVVNSIGFTVYRGTDHEVDLNASGIYIVKMRGKTVKFNVK